MGGDCGNDRVGLSTLLPCCLGSLALGEDMSLLRPEAGRAALWRRPRREKLRPSANASTSLPAQGTPEVTAAQTNTLTAAF